MASDVFALTTFESFKILFRDDDGIVRPRVVSGHRYLDFAAHRTSIDLFRESWTITHLPSGHAAALGFYAIEPAVGAMIEIARLRNDWACLDDDGTTHAVAAKVEEIVKRHDERARVANGRKSDELHRGLNGYAESASA